MMIIVLKATTMEKKKKMMMIYRDLPDSFEQMNEGDSVLMTEQSDYTTGH